MGKSIGKLEMVLGIQLDEYFENIFDDALLAFSWRPQQKQHQDNAIIFEWEKNIGKLEMAQVNGLVSLKTPQGSILGPILFNIFSNDLLKFIKKIDLLNYVDDNTINAIESPHQSVVQTLQIEFKAAINWFTLKEMLANQIK